VNKVTQNDGVKPHQLHQRDAAPAHSRSNQFICWFHGLRLCMAASRSAQRKKQASRTKRLQTKTISASHNLLNPAQQNRRAIFSACRRISLTKFMKVLSNGNRRA
jgi:hypothetical protein